MGNCSTCTCTDKNEVSTFELQVNGSQGGSQKVSNGVETSNNSNINNGPQKNGNASSRKVRISLKGINDH